MSPTSWLPKPMRRVLSFVRYELRDVLLPKPQQVVKANTAAAFDFFWSQRRFINQSYLSPGRIQFYEQMAEWSLRVLASMPVRHDAQGRLQPLRVLDVGCGSGEFLKILQSRSPSSNLLELHGVDFSQAAIIHARKLLPSAQFAVADIHAMNLPAASFDLVICMETLEHVLEPDHALSELKNLVRPHGQMLISIPDGSEDKWDGHRHFWTLDQLVEWVGRDQVLKAMRMPDSHWISVQVQPTMRDTSSKRHDTQLPTTLSSAA